MRPLRPAAAAGGQNRRVRAVWGVARAELRRRWRQLAVLSLAVGLAAGFAITAGVGARRASTAWERLRTLTRAPDGMFSVPPDTAPPLLARLRAGPGVSAVGGFSYTPVAPAPLKPGQDAGAFVALDRSF